MMLKQKGLSLVELLISITLGLILLTGVMKVFLSSKTVFSTQQALSRVQETGRLAVDFISRDIRMAGFMGCDSNPIKGQSKNITNILNTPNDFRFNFTEYIRGYTAETVPAGLSPTPKPLTDILVIRSANGNGARTTANSTATTLNIAVDSTEAGACGTTDRISGFCVNDIAVLTDCVKSSVFQITAITAGGAVSHQSGSAATVSGNYTPGNSVTNWSTQAGAVFKSGAELLLASNTIYFIATGTSQRPSLWQKINGASAVEILEGVENMSIKYGIDTDAGFDLIPNIYKKAADVTAAEWDRVVSVRVELLVASIEDNVTTEIQKYSFNVDEVPDPVDPNDHRLRQVFTSAVGIRSRLE
ncbi:MAG: hypothetical protein EOO52_18920 [Gammaproteobacteria bacterium]|nr:MAG: hypothetical protein EOO52_18920 [Gammaproteobacteria bacterium]